MLGFRNSCQTLLKHTTSHCVLAFFFNNTACPVLFSGRCGCHTVWCSQGGKFGVRRQKLPQRRFLRPETRVSRRTIRANSVKTATSA